MALVDGWFRFVEQRTLPGGCFINAASSKYRARPGRIRDQINEHRAATRERFRKLIREAVEAGELRPEVEADQLVFELVACQAAANVAALMNDRNEFVWARIGPKRSSHRSSTVEMAVALGSKVKTDSMPLVRRSEVSQRQMSTTCSS
nr:hypothetical protein [Sphingobium lactosutens]